MNLKLYTILLLIIASVLVGCEKLEDTYSEYLENEKVYAPRIKNLEAKTGLKEVTLLWENPVGDVAKAIFIDYQDNTITTESMIDSIYITDLEIKGYEISVYTIDAFNNLSVPTSINVFPNGEDDK